MTSPRRSPLRRWAAPAALVLSAALALSACAANPADEATDETESSLLPAAEGTTDYPLTLTTWAGETVLEERPERVAVIGFSPNLDALEAIGATPVYILDDSEWQWNDQEWRSSIEFTDTATRADPLNFEGIAATQPDLIVATNFVFDQETFDRLAEIAPVLENPEEVDGAAIDWRDTQRLIGEALDLSDASDQAIAEAEEAIAATAAEHPEFADTTATIAYHYTGYPLEYYTPTGGTAESLLLELGFAPNPLGEPFATVPEVADENLGQLDADRLVVFYNTAEERDTREATDVFQSIPAVADGRYLPVVFEVDGEYTPEANASWVLRRGASALSLPWAADVVADWYAQIDAP
jgi:iron complex transport system substrate-binding protein